MKDGGLTTGYATGGLTETEEQIKNETKATIRCIPLDAAVVLE